MELNLTGYINSLTDEREKVRKKIAAEKCPFEVGETVINNKGVKASITTISWSSIFGYKIFITKFNNDRHWISTI